MVLLSLKRNQRILINNQRILIITSSMSSSEQSSPNKDDKKKRCNSDEKEEQYHHTHTKNMVSSAYYWVLMLYAGYVSNLRKKTVNEGINTALAQIQTGSPKGVKTFAQVMNIEDTWAFLETNVESIEEGRYGLQWKHQ